MLKPLFGRQPTATEIRYYYDTSKVKQERHFSLEEKRKYRPVGKFQSKARILEERERAMAEKVYKVRIVVVKTPSNDRYRENQIKLREMIAWHTKTCTDIPKSVRELFIKYKIDCA